MFETLVTLFHRGGPEVMSAISLVFVLSVVIILERTIRYWFQYDMHNSEAFMTNIQKLVMSNSIENAIRMCKGEKNKLLPFVIAEGLKRANDSAEEIDHAIDHANLSVIPKVTRLVSALGTTANVATLLGLLGTIFGLIRSFAAAANATGAEKQTLLAEGIAEALTATSFGLSTALLCLLAHGLLSLKQQAIISDIQQNSALLTDLLYTRKMKNKA